MKKVFSCRILQDTKVLCPFRKKSPSTKVVCPFRENPPSTKVVCPHLCSKRIGRYVIIHDVNSRQDGVEPVGMLKVRPSQEEINNSIRPNNSCGCQNAERFPCYTTSPATKSILGPPSDCASIRPTCNLTIIINNTNHYNHSGHSNLERPGASAVEYSGRNTRNYFCDGKYFCRCI